MTSMRPKPPPLPARCLLLLAPAVAACSTPKEAPPPEKPLALQTQWSLPTDWTTLSPLAFEELCLEEFPEDASTPFDAEAREAQRNALDRMDASSVRAAVLLGRSRHPTNASILIRRLEKRELGPKRTSDAGDVVAAASIARFPDPARFAQRLVPLATGDAPHPDLEVRVECAATALYAGFGDVAPFLLRVLRIGTWAGMSDERDFPTSDTTAWARGRAAEALSLFAGVPLSYPTDGPIVRREEETRRLEALIEEALEEGSDDDTQGSTR